jgi:hypothetical protein
VRGCKQIPVPEVLAANHASFLSPQFSQALAVRSYTKFVMGVSQASCPSLPFPVGLGGLRRPPLLWLDAGPGVWHWHSVSAGPKCASSGWDASTQVSGFQIAVSMLTYPFLLVGDLMAVNNCGYVCTPPLGPYPTKISGDTWLSSAAPPCHCVWLWDSSNS